MSVKGTTRYVYHFDWMLVIDSARAIDNVSLNARCLVPLLCVEVGWGDGFVGSSKIFCCFSVQNQAQQAVEGVRGDVSQTSDLVEG